MLQSLLALIILSLFLGAGAWMIFLWATKKGQFDDAEEPKYRMLMEDQDKEDPMDKTTAPKKREE